MRDADLERLDDYVRGAKHADDASYEEDLFARALDGTAKELVAYDSLTASLRVHADRGTLPNYTTEAGLERLRLRHGDRLAFATSARSIPIPADAELLVIQVPMDLADVDRVDVENVIDGVGPVKTMPDVVFEKGGRALYLCCEADLARRAAAAGSTGIITRFWGYRGGERRLLVETNWTGEEVRRLL